MVSFLITLIRLLKGIRRSFKDKNFQVLFILILLMLVSGTLFYTGEEGLGVVDALYFCITTLSTVGHPDFEPQTTLGKIFTMIYIVVGTGLFLGLMFYVARAILNRKEDDNGAKK
ncbi:potassium channel family protein [Cohnella cholangitidis]|uniref:Two pore domain potassium channel family protein n=1 Tax=Cohnella cholangitidis TaxID=2598458 RepID=A0A7G5BWZ1_9BACL|nr:potassium channel family protein [Cohnella cholangitidis]QMV41475.1 two pore domain potassium channel family protein [Cohnella cholangitidis]